MTTYDVTIMLAHLWACAAVLQVAHGIVIDPFLLLLVSISVAP